MPRCGCPLAGRGVLLGLLRRPGKAEVATERCPAGLWEAEAGGSHG
jgi:hypothetical protein